MKSTKILKFAFNQILSICVFCWVSLPMKWDLLCGISVCMRLCVFLWSWSKTVAVGVVGNVNKCACLRPGEKATSDRVSERLFTAVQRVCVCMWCLHLCQFWQKTKRERRDRMTRKRKYKHIHSLSLCLSLSHTHTLYWPTSAPLNYAPNYCNHYNHL